METRFIQIRASRASIAVLMGGLTLPLLISLLAAVKQPSMWVAVFVCLAGMISVFFLVNSYQVKVENGLLNYSSPFGKLKSIRLDDIKSVHIEIGYARYRDRFKPPVRLIICARSGIENCNFAINLKVFSKRDIEQLFFLLKVQKLA